VRGVVDCGLPLGGAFPNRARHRENYEFCTVELFGAVVRGSPNAKMAKEEFASGHEKSRCMRSKRVLLPETRLASKVGFFITILSTGSFHLPVHFPS